VARAASVGRYTTLIAKNVANKEDVANKIASGRCTRTKNAGRSVATSEQLRGGDAGAFVRQGCYLIEIAGVMARVVSVKALLTMASTNTLRLFGLQDT
jgi:hypothetical protein